MDFILKVQWSGEGMDENLINQLLALPGEELHLNVCVQRHRSGGLLCLFHSL